ncbi:hypothetical protein TNCV_2163751 [Trichonephila clavipes]|nr:hypothetical protein TNCV_2163751 [Trichonephila clavipes]
MSPSNVPSGNLTELIRTVTCMVAKANDRRTSRPCDDEFRPEVILSMVKLNLDEAPQAINKEEFVYLRAYVYKLL